MANNPLLGNLGLAVEAKHVKPAIEQVLNECRSQLADLKQIMKQVGLACWIQWNFSAASSLQFGLHWTPADGEKLRRLARCLQ